MSAAARSGAGAGADDDQERGPAVADPTTRAGDKKAAPEHELNIVVIATVFTRRLADGVGKLAVLWSTVVLLGGFASALSTKDFAYVTAITLVAATGLFSRSEDPRSRFLFDVLPAMYREFDKKTDELLYNPTSAGRKLVLALFFMVAVPLGLVILFAALLPFTGAAACVVLSALQLATQGYSREELSAVTAIHLRTALNIFYSIALIQGGFFCISAVIDAASVMVKINVSSHYGPKKDEYWDVVDDYKNHINKKSADGDVLEIAQMTLQRFAVEMLESSSEEKQRSGIQVVCRFIEMERLTEVVKEIQLLPTAMGGIIHLARSDEAEDKEFRDCIKKLKAKLPKKMQEDLD